MPRRIRPTTVHPQALRELQVLRVADITPGLRRVTMTGAQLGAFSPTPGLDLPEFASTGFDDDVRMLFPYPGETVPVLPTYQDGKLVPAKDPSPLGRYYTVRRYDPPRGSARIWCARSTILNAGSASLRTITIRD